MMCFSVTFQQQFCGGAVLSRRAPIHTHSCFLKLSMPNPCLNIYFVLFVPMFRVNCVELLTTCCCVDADVDAVVCVSNA